MSRQTRAGATAVDVRPPGKGRRRESGGQRRRRTLVRGRARRGQRRRRQQAAGRPIPHPERLTGHGRMRQFVRYVEKVFKLSERVRKTVCDGRRSPTYPIDTIVLLCIVMFVTRHRSFNAFKERLLEPAMKRLLGGRALPVCVDTIGDALKKVDPESLRELHRQILAVAEKNKVFRRAWHGGRRYFAFDGFEQFRSRKLRCNECHVAVIDKEKEGQHDEYFHRFLVMYSIGPAPELILDVAPLLGKPRFLEQEAEKVKAEGELTTVRRGVAGLRAQFPKLFDVGVGDALYSNGPMLRFMREGRPAYHLIAILKKEKEEPLKDAIDVYARLPPTDQYYDEAREEWVRVWDTGEFATLASCPFPLRVLKVQKVAVKKAQRKARLNWDDPKTVATWWILTTLPREELPAAAVFDVQRHRWDQENGHCELTQHWGIKHNFVHHPVATPAVMLLIAIAYNLFQLFCHRCLSAATRTAFADVEVARQMLLDYPQLRSRHEGFAGPAAG